MVSERCFYLTDTFAQGNAAFWRFSEMCDNYEIASASFYQEAKRAAWLCHNSRKRNRVYKGETRKLIDLWWTYYYLRKIKLNGQDLGHLYMKIEGLEL